MTVEETLNPANDGRCLSASREALGKFSVPDIFRLEKCEDDQGEQLHLVLSAIWEVRGEATSQLGQGNGRRALFSRVRRDFSSPSENCRALSAQQLQPLAHHAEPQAVLHAVVVVLEGAAGVFRAGR
ncbi:MAG: hypothetical protein ACR2J4_08360 [Deinococcus sp.]